MAFGLSAGAAALVGSIAAPVIGGLIGGSASRQAASAQADSAGQSLALQKQMFDEQNALNKPFRDNGLQGQNRLMDLLGLSGNTGAAGYGSANKQFGAGDMQADDGYQFRLAQGQKALERSQAARGGVMSGAAVKAASDYNQGAASQEYQNAYNRFQTDRSNVLNPLQSLAGQGQTAAGTMSSDAGAFSNAASGSLAKSGAAQASGYMGQGAALQNGITSYQNNQLMNRLFPTSTTTSNPYAVDPYAGSSTKAALYGDAGYG